MKEAVFIRQNTERWEDYENNPTDHPDELTARFIALTDDLAYARTFYPASPVVSYLNGLTGDLYRKLYSNRPVKRGRIGAFWLRELPLLMAGARKELLYSLVFFLLAFLTGWISAAHDDTFVRLIMGDQYVDQTLRNIENGDPLAIYKSQSEGDMFLGITFNNVRVSFIAFVMGIFFSAGTVVVLFRNGIMLGAFQYFFYERGLLAESVLKIWIHGTLEISAIIIAGCAGLVLGNSLLFPGTFSRLHAFRQGAMKGLKITVGLLPVFVAAGFLESFVTRLDLPVWASIGIITISAIFIVGYFIVYSLKCAKREIPAT